MPPANKPLPVGQRVFRPRIDVVIGRVVLPFVFLLVFFVTAINLLDGAASPGWLLLALLPTAGVVAAIYAIPVLLGHIIVEKHQIFLAVDGLRLGFFWRDVRAVQIVREGGDPFLVLGVQSGLYTLSLNHFDPLALWEAIRQAAPPDITMAEALHPYERLDAGEGIPPSLWLVGKLQVADRRGLVAAGGFGAAGCIVLFLLAVLASQPGALLYLALSVVYVLLLTGVGTTELDMQGITRRTIWGSQRIEWGDLDVVEFGPFGLRIVLEGTRNRRLVMFGPPLWIGADAARATHFLAQQISTRRLIRRHSLLVLLKTSRNTRIDGA